MQNDSDPSFWLHQALKHMSPIDTSTASPEGGSCVTTTCFQSYLENVGAGGHLLPWACKRSCSDLMPNERECATGTARNQTTMLTLCPSIKLKDRTLHCRVRLKPSPSIFRSAAPCFHEANPSLSPALASHGLSSHQAARRSYGPLYGEATNWHLSEV